MDAVKFINEETRMCGFYTFCLACPFCMTNNKLKKPCNELKRINPEEYVSTVEKWSAEHPVETRQSEFLKMVPNAPLRENGSIAICPLDVDRYAKCSEKQGARCPDCQKEYWLAEVE